MAATSQLRKAALRLLRLVFSRFVSTSAAGGHLEVERKFEIKSDEVASLPERLRTLGFTYAGTMDMTDSFLPTLEAGEMMRVRQERLDDGPVKSVLTLKKWVPTTTGKERKETERSVPSSIAAIWLFVARFANGEPLLSFSKERQLFDGKLAGSDAVVSIDNVEGLGSFSGSYLEIEVIVPLGGDPARFKDAIFELATSIFGAARDDVKRSYQDMLKASRA